MSNGSSSYESLLKYYQHSIIEFQKYVKENYKDYINKYHRGYLIKLEDYEGLKTKLLTKNGIDIISNPKCLKEIKFRSTKYFINMLLNGNDYILINSNLWEIFGISKNNNSVKPIMYSIDFHDIKFKLDCDIELKLWCPNADNIINAKSFTFYNSMNYYKQLKLNYQNIEQMYKEISDYYKFENNLKNNLKQNIKKNNYGVFININWLKKWKVHTNYQKIYEYLEKTKNGKIIKDIIIYFEEIENKKQALGPIEIVSIISKSQLKNHLENYSLALVDITFVNNFATYFSYFKYYTNENTIEIEINADILKVNTASNIISLKSNNQDYGKSNINIPKSLEILIKLLYFNRELKKKINSPYEEKNNDATKEYYFINKEFVKNYINFYDFIPILDLINKASELSHINYQNLKTNFPFIIKYLENSKNDCLYELIQKGKSEELLFTNKNYLINYKIYEKDGKKLKYLTDFEILDEDIISSFEKINIPLKKVLNKGPVIFGDNKIFLSFDETYQTYFQICDFDNKSETLIPEFVIENKYGIKKIFINYFKENGILFFLNNKKEKGSLYLSNGEIGTCYDIKNSETSMEKEEPLDSEILINDKNIQRVSGIYSILLNYYLFQNKIRSKILDSQNILNSNVQTQIIDYYLINKEIFSEFLNSFWNDIISEIITKYEINVYSDIKNNIVEEIIKDKDSKEHIKLILNNMDNFDNNIKHKDIFKIDTSNINTNNEKNLLIFPKNLMFLEDNLLKIFLEFLGIPKNNNIDDYKILLAYNFGSIIFRGVIGNFLNNNRDVAFVYNMEELKEIKNINFSLEAILYFTNYTDYINIFPKLINEMVLFKCKKYPENFEYKYRMKIHLIKKNEQDKFLSTPTSGLNNDDIFNNSENQKQINKNLLTLVNIYNEFLNLSNIIKQPIKSSTEISFEKYYLINNKYLEDFAIAFSFKEIKKAINKIDNFYIDFRYKQTEFLNDIKNKISNETKMKLINPKNIPDFSKLNNYESYKIEKSFYEGSQQLYYYQNCTIINEKIYKYLNEFVDFIFHIVEIIDCAFDYNHIFINLTTHILVGHLDEKSRFNAEHLLSNSKYQRDIPKIFYALKLKGYNLIQQSLKNSCIQISIRYNNYDAFIYSIHKNEIINTNGNYSNLISEKLKSIILLYLELQKADNNRIYQSDKLGEEVYLINEEILSNPFLNEVQLIINNEKKVKDLVQKFKIPKNYTHLNVLNDFISQIDNQKLKQLDSKIINTQFQVAYPYSQEIILKTKQKIPIYRRFIMLQKHILEIIGNNLEIEPKIPKLFYKRNIGDYIIDKQNKIVYYGKIKDDNYYEVNYILIFTDNLEDELVNLFAYGFEKYLEKYAIFNTENQNDIISPIFKGKDIIGHCYHIIPGKNNYSNSFDYSIYLGNEILQKVWNLYIYYKEFKNNMNQDYYPKENEYYLIKKNIMSHVKKEYYYQEIINLIEKEYQNEITQENQFKILLYVLKYLPENILEDIISKEKKIEMIPLDSMIPDIQGINENDSNNETQMAYIYNKFEIISPNIAKDFIKDISYDFYIYEKFKPTNNLMNCILKNKKILLKYPSNLFGNKKDIAVIGTIDSENSFLNEYVFIYDKYYELHISRLKNENLNNYLKNLQPYNNICPIVINDFNEIGKIFIIPKNNQNIDINIDNTINVDKNKPEIGIPQGGTKNYDLTAENNDNDNDTFIDETNEKEYNLHSISNCTSIIQSFAYPPLIGLDNIGATCYMNATLQCLCNIEKFVSYFKYHRYLINTVSEDKGKKKLCSSFKLLIEKLWPDNYDPNAINKKNQIYKSHGFYSNQYENIFGIQKKNDSFPPDNFKKKISWMNSLFEGVAANDAKDLVQFLIMKLHTELNRVKGNNNINNIPVQNQRNKQLMFQAFASDFVANNASLISDLFYAVNYSITECGYCHSQSFNYQTYFFLVFPLEEVRIFKSQNTMNFNYNNFFNNNEVNIYDCFFYDQKITYMAGNNAMYCNYCKQTCNNTMRTILATGPEILIIILNRGKGTEFKVKINFLEQIDLTNFIEMKQTGCKYNLIGVITHIGESGMGGHFIAYCRNPISKDWHKYNDSIVTPVTDFKKDVIDFAMPYLLFYQKIS